MANEEALGPRKTMFVLVIVVGCFAVLWPRILSPLLLGSSKDQLKPNQFDRDAGCCEVLFDSEVAILEILNEVCNSVVHVTGKLSPYAAAECRKTVNDTCGVDIATFLKRDENVGKTTKRLLDTMKSSNSSCLKEHFGVPVLSLTVHPAYNSWRLPDSVKQERPALRGGPGHPALRERGRAIPPGAPTPPSRGPVPMPAHMRVRSSPLSGYFELDIKPPPIPGMRPPLGSAGGPVAAPKSSMGFVMPIYTICIIVFFVYTLSKILFKRTGSPYEELSPDPQFRRRVFRDDSRTSPDKLGHKERDTIVSAISGLVAEVQQQMSTPRSPQDAQRDNESRSHTNGTILHNSGPVHIVASEYDRDKEKTTELIETKPEVIETKPEVIETKPEVIETKPEVIDTVPEVTKTVKETTPELEANHVDRNELLKLSNADVSKEDTAKKSSEEFLQETRKELEKEEAEEEKESLREASPEEQENASVKVLGMEVRAHAADGGSWPRGLPPAPPPPAPHAAPAADVASIFLEREIPQQSRLLVDFEQEEPRHSNTPLVVSGKMTLSLIQDEPRDTPERELESTMDDFTTASAVTQPAIEIPEELPNDDAEEEVVESEEEEEEEEEEDKSEEVVAAKDIKVVQAAADTGDEEDEEEEVEVEEIEVDEEVEEEEIEVEVTDSEDELQPEDKNTRNKH